MVVARLRARSFRVVSALTLSAVISVLALGCTKKGGAGSDLEVETASGEKLKLAYNETLRINVTSEPPSLDWHKATDTTSSQILTNIQDCLTDFDLQSADMHPVPALAEKWVASNGNKTWKFTLRENMKWSDGQAFKAQHVVDGFKRLLNRETASEYAYFLFGIKNARAFNEGKTSWDAVGAKVTGDREVTIELEKPMSYFPSLLAHHSTAPIRLDVIEKHGDKWTAPENIVTVGPFNLKVWQHDKMIVLERNENYYAAKPEIKYVAVYMIQEQATAINLFDSGKLDSVHQLPSIELRKLSQRKEFKKFGSVLTYYYGFNVTKAPLDNLNVRKAVASAIDRNELTQMLGGGQKPLMGWIPEGLLGHDPERGMKFDVVKAKEYLKAAGFEDASKLPKIEIKFNTNEDHQRIAENIQAQLKKNLGIDVELKNEEWKVFLSTLKTDPPQIFRFGWLADYPDPNNFVELITSFSDNNHTKWKNTKFDDLVVKAASESSEAERKKLYSEAQKILLEDDVAVVPLYNNVGLLLVADRVENYPMNSMWRYEYKNVKLKAQAK